MNATDRLTEYLESDDTDADPYAIAADAWNETFQDREADLAPHTHHLIRKTDTKQTVDAALAERNDLDEDIVGLMRVIGFSCELEPEVATYCFTCNDWVGVEFRGHLRSTEDAFYYMGPPPEIQELKRDAVREWREQMLEVRNKHPHIDDLDDASEFLKQQIDEATDRLTEQVEEVSDQ